jgi:hypothetical protein
LIQLKKMRLFIKRKNNIRNIRNIKNIKNIRKLMPKKLQMLIKKLNTHLKKQKSRKKLKNRKKLKRKNSECFIDLIFWHMIQYNINDQGWEFLDLEKSLKNTVLNFISLMLSDDVKVWSPVD